MAPPGRGRRRLAARHPHRVAGERGRRDGQSARVTRWRRWVAGFAAATVAMACGADAPERADPAAAIAGALERLRAFETTRRSATDFRTLPPAELATGPDPIAIRRMPGQSRLLGLLRGRAALVLLDEELHEMARVRAPDLPTGLAIADDGDILVSGEASRVIARYALRGSRLVRRGGFRVPGPVSIRALAAGPDGVVYAADDHDDRLLTLDRRGRVLAGEGESIGLGPRHAAAYGASSIGRTASWRIPSSSAPSAPPAFRYARTRSASHTTGPSGRWTHARPMTASWWRSAASRTIRSTARRGRSATSTRSSGSTAITGRRPRRTRLAAVNVSALGVVTPKVVTLLDAGGTRSTPRAWLRRRDGGRARLERPRPTRKGVWPQPAVQSRRARAGCRHGGAARPAAGPRRGRSAARRLGARRRRRGASGVDRGRGPSAAQHRTRVWARRCSSPR